MKSLYKLISVLLVAAFALTAFAPAAQAAQTEEPGTIVDVVLAANAETGEFSILIQALQAAHPSLLRNLSSDREFTVFAPTDAAFTAALEELGMTAEELLSDQPMLSRILRYHIVRGELDAAEVLERERIRTTQGGRIFQSDGILTDANGRTANIIQTDIQASNGVIHVIDNVLLPRERPEVVEGSIVDVVLEENAETGEFSILIQALQAANPSILNMLSRTGEYTVLAPTDEAFAALLDELGVTAEELLGNRPLLSRVLRYHIVRGTLDAEAVLASERLRTLQGGWIFQNEGILTDANGRTANIIAVDIPAANGIIHVIDNVLLPRMDGGDGDEAEFEAALTGDQEVPPVETDMRGDVEIEVENSRLDVELSISNNMHDIFAAHIHCAPPGENGPVGVTLFMGSFTEESGMLIDRDITTPDADNACGWMDIDDVVAAMESGNAYVNVHTTAESGGVPSGEIRGDLLPDEAND